MDDPLGPPRAVFACGHGNDAHSPSTSGLRAAASTGRCWSDDAASLAGPRHHDQPHARVRRQGRRRVQAPGPLTYDAPTGTGKTTAQTDTYHGRFTRLVPDTEVVQVVEFETPDPALGGAMTITYTLADAGDGGTVLTGTHREPPARRAARGQRARLEPVHRQACQAGRGRSRRGLEARQRGGVGDAAEVLREHFAANTGSSGAAAANSVTEQRSFIASTGPKMSSAVWPSVPATMRAIRSAGGRAPGGSGTPGLR